MPLSKVSKAASFPDLRPVSILPTFLKIIESLALRSFWLHLEKYSILPSTQSGFRKLHSTATALSKLINDLIDLGKVSTVVSLDLSKAFDSLNHSLVLAKLKYMGCNPIDLKWFSKFLCNRIQHVAVDGLISGGLLVLLGVLQKTLLDPSIFSVSSAAVIYFFLPYTFCNLYADDIEFDVVFEAQEINFAAERFNSNLESIHKWCKWKG